MIRDFDEELVVRRVPRRFSRRVWEWQVWRTVERESRWGDTLHRRAVVASGRRKTQIEAETEGRLALVVKIETKEGTE